MRNGGESESDAVVLLSFSVGSAAAAASPIVWLVDLIWICTYCYCWAVSIISHQSHIYTHIVLSRKTLLIIPFSSPYYYFTYSNIQRDTHLYLYLFLGGSWQVVQLQQKYATVQTKMVNDVLIFGVSFFCSTATTKRLFCCCCSSVAAAEETSSASASTFEVKHLFSLKLACANQQVGCCWFKLCLPICVCVFINILKGCCV